MTQLAHHPATHSAHHHDHPPAVSLLSFQGLRLLSTADLKRECLARNLMTGNSKRDIVKLLAPVMYEEIHLSNYPDDRLVAEAWVREATL